ncbi:MAG: radical SAM protein [Verrucomicrobia bacterium]|nr:radical SAM protein [Verrucomicrobiota bacterium]
MPAIAFRPRADLLKRTTTRCPECRRAVPGEVWREGAAPGRVVLRRECPDHGAFEATLASDARFYWVAQGDPCNSASGCCPPAAASGPAGTLGRNAAGRQDGPFESLSTCLALIEIVNSCNLSCPTCYAESPVGTGAVVDAVPLDDLQRRIEGVIARKGGIEILQLSGGEPTLHPQFFELLAWAQGHERIDFVLVNTNGVRLAQDPEFAERLAIAAARKGLQLYLQFDGVQEAGQRMLRGADLRAVRERALEVCGRIGLSVTLAFTVTRANLPHLWEAITFGLERPQVHGISFQPLFQSGRLPAPVPAGSGSERLNVADVLLAAVDQSGGQLRFEDFTPLPCGDPNCATIGYLLRLGGRVHSVSEFLDFSQLQGFLKDKMNYRLEDLARCGCETEPLGTLLHRLELQASVAFRILVKPFMDAWSWDQDRIDRCCTHVIRPDGRLDSFCRYYSGFPDTRPAP